MSKTFVGPQLRQLRRQHRHTQAEMAERLRISPAYVNLLESNQRSLSVRVLMNLIEAYGVDLRDVVNDREVTLLADLRASLQDPAFGRTRPDLQELRAAIDHAPRLVESFLSLYRSHRGTVDRLAALGSDDGGDLLATATPETEIHDFFRSRANHFDRLERKAEAARAQVGGPADDMYALLKRHLLRRHGVTVAIARISEMPETLRRYDRDAARVDLSEALDHPNRIFQMAHVLARFEAGAELDAIAAESGIAAEPGHARLLVELANYFAAAFLMPYDEVLSLAEITSYDLDRIAAAMGTSFEQVAHRLTTLQRDGARGVPFFFLRVDKAGNVTKRFNATPIALAERGGSCPVWTIHDAFRQPGVTLPQVVEMPDGAQFFTIARTSDRPVFSRRTPDRRVVVALGCERAHAERIGYARELGAAAEPAPIGTSCALCPRQACPQRAHRPLHMDLPIDTETRGRTRYES